MTIQSQQRMYGSHHRLTIHTVYAGGECPGLGPEEITW
jgi:hypothetical protein